jgi:hypothetical protein
VTRNVYVEVPEVICGHCFKCCPSYSFGSTRSFVEREISNLRAHKYPFFDFGLVSPRKRVSRRVTTVILIISFPQEFSLNQV